MGHLAVDELEMKQESQSDSEPTSPSGGVAKHGICVTIPTVKCKAEVKCAPFEILTVVLLKFKDLWM
jgi:hypothetical protein